MLSLTYNINNNNYIGHNREQNLQTLNLNTHYLCNTKILWVPNPLWLETNF